MPKSVSLILVIDNYDSFTFNLVQYLGQCCQSPVVKRNDQVGLAEIEQMSPQAVLLSPGPKTPAESQVCVEICQAALDPASVLYGRPLLGVCLGHQTIGMVAGGTVTKAKTVMHGKASDVQHDGAGVFLGLDSPLRVIRYHSLTVTEDGLRESFTVTSRATDDGEVMGIRHKSLPIEGVQFHPESVLTVNGLSMIRNFVNLVPHH